MELSLASNKGIKLLGTRLSQPTRAVEILMRATGIEFQFIPHVPRATAPFNLRDLSHGVGRIPVFLDDAFSLYESQAIMIYLARTRRISHPSIAQWYPGDSDPKTSAQIDRYMSWHHTGLRLGAGSFMFQSFVIPATTKRGVNEFEVARAKKILGHSLKYLERVLTEADYVAGTSYPTIADLMAATELSSLVYALDWKPTGNTAKWFSAMETIEGWTHVHRKLPSLSQNFRKILAKKGIPVAKL